MHFIVEAANHNNKPSQCYKCFKYGHAAKYCRADNQICSRCAGTNHKYDDCPNTNKQPICCNCRGEHTATSPDCPKYIQYQQRIQRTIDQYSSSTKQTKTSQMQLNWNINEEFPVLKSANNIDQMRIIETLTEKIMVVIEQATRRIFETLNQNFEILTDQLSKKLNIEINEISPEDNDKLQTKNKNTTRHKQRTEETGNENADSASTPSNGIKRKHISPTSLPDKPTESLKDSEIQQDEITVVHIDPNK
jgi:hypothetical protein